MIPSITSILIEYQWRFADSVPRSSFEKFVELSFDEFYQTVLKIVAPWIPRVSTHFLFSHPTALAERRTFLSRLQEISERRVSVYDIVSFPVILPRAFPPNPNGGRPIFEICQQGTAAGSSSSVETTPRFCLSPRGSRRIPRFTPRTVRSFMNRVIPSSGVMRGRGGGAGSDGKGKRNDDLDYVRWKVAR